MFNYEVLDLEVDWKKVEQILLELIFHAFKNHDPP